MSNGIINFQIEEAFKNIGDGDVNNNFVGVFPSNYMSKFIDHKTMISEKKGKFPFHIANTDSPSKEDNHWWSILNRESKTYIFFFDKFGVYGWRAFIIQDNKKVIEKIIFGVEQIARSDNKITPANIRFHFNAYKNLSKKELDTLSDTASNFFCFIQP